MKTHRIQIFEQNTISTEDAIYNATNTNICP